MRRNLDQSEAAIIQVFEEKQRVWERQMDELRQNYASRLQQVTPQHLWIPLKISRKECLGNECFSLNTHETTPQVDI